MDTKKTKEFEHMFVMKYKVTKTLYKKIMEAIEKETIDIKEYEVFIDELDAFIRLTENII